jgi:hypothetical protein
MTVTDSNGYYSPETLRALQQEFDAACQARCIAKDSREAELLAAAIMSRKTTTASNTTSEVTRRMTN